MKTFLLSLTIAITSITPGICGVEQVLMDQNGQNIVFYSPIISTPTGFSLNQDESLKQHKRIYTQNDSSSTVIYSSSAILKSDTPNIYTIDHFISEDLKSIKASDPSVYTIGLQGANTGDGIPLNAILITSQVTKDIQVVAYQEDGKHYVKFNAVLKGKDTPAGVLAFLKWLNSYYINSK